MLDNYDIFNLKTFFDFIFRNSPSSEEFDDQNLKEIADAMDVTDHDVSREISSFPNFSLGFNFLWEVISAAKESARDTNSSTDNTKTFSERRNGDLSVKQSFAVPQDGSSCRRNASEFPNFTKITQHSKETTERSCQRRLSDQQTENKASFGQFSCPTSKSTKIEPSKVTNSTVSNGSSAISGQRFASNSSLTAQNKSSSHSDGQRPTANAHAKLQVVTPSCRPNNLGTRPAISPLLTVRIIEPE